jgi:hypothetical protein
MNITDTRCVEDITDTDTRPAAEGRYALRASYEVAGRAVDTTSAETLGEFYGRTYATRADAEAAAADAAADLRACDPSGHYDGVVISVVAE